MEKKSHGTFYFCRAVLVSVCAVVTPFGVLLALSALLGTSIPAAANPYGFKERRYLTFFEASNFTTSKNFDDSGNSISLPTNNKFTENSFDLFGAYDISDFFGVHTAIGFKYNDAVTYPIERTNSGFSDFSFGADALLWSGILNVIPDVSASLPLYATPGSDNSVLLGDGATSVTAKLTLSKNFRKISLASFGGYTYRTNDLSAQIPWGVSAEYTAGPLFFEGAFRQSISVGTDLYPTSSIARRFVTDRLSGGSLLYDSIDPSSTTLGARVGVAVGGGFFATAGVEQVLSGQRTAQGTRFLLGFGLSGAVHPPRAKIVSYPNEDVEQFDVDTGEEDPSDASSEAKAGVKSKSKPSSPQRQIPAKSPSLVH